MTRPSAGRRWGIRTRLLLVTSLLVVLPYTVAIAAILEAVTQHFREIAQRRLLAVEGTISDAFRQWEEELKRTLETIAYRSPLIEDIARALGGGLLDPALFFERMEQTAQAYGLDRLEVLERDGTIVVAYGPARERFGFPDRHTLGLVEAFAGAGRFVVEGGEEGDRLDFRVAQRVRVAGHDLILSVGRRIDRKSIRALSRSTGAWVTVAPSPEAWRTIAERIGLVEGRGGRPLRGTVGGEPYALRRMPLATFPPGGGSALLFGISERESEDLRHYIESVAAFIGSLGLVVALLATLLVGRTLSAPLLSLAQGVRRVAGGDLEVVVERTTRDEIGDLVTAFNEMTRDLRRYRRRLQYTERIAAWQEIARRMAHEIKNPLFPIQTSMENLQKAYERNLPEFPEILEEAGRIVLEEVESLERIIDEFSRFARLPAPRKQPCDLNDLVRDALPFVTERAPRIVVRLALAGTLPPLALDRDLIVHRVLHNLLKNAVEAMEGEGELSIETLQEADVVELRIRDSGPGIPPALREKIFTPYFTTKPEGTGLGLAISHRIVQDHGGTIEVESTPSGTTMIVRFPRLAPPNEDGRKPR